MSVHIFAKEKFRIILITFIKHAKAIIIKFTNMLIINKLYLTLNVRNYENITTVFSMNSYISS